MPRHDWQCPSCGHIDPDVYSAMPSTDAAGVRTPPRPSCGTCATEMVQLWASVSNDLFHEDFVVDVSDGLKSYTGRVSSLRELRTIERESENHARNEPHAAPLVWRDFSQDASNRSVNSLRGTSYEKARSRPLDRNQRSTSRGLPISVRPTRD